jgi:hypothetical protein
MESYKVQFIVEYDVVKKKKKKKKEKEDFEKSLAL